MSEPAPARRVRAPLVELTLARVREMIIDAVPAGLKEATACGIGVFIALIGLKNAGLIAADPATLLCLGDLSRPGPLIAAAGILTDWAGSARVCLIISAHPAGSRFRPPRPRTWP